MHLVLYLPKAGLVTSGGTLRNATFLSLCGFGNIDSYQLQRLLHNEHSNTGRANDYTHEPSSSSSAAASIPSITCQRISSARSLRVANYTTIPLLQPGNQGVPSGSPYSRVAWPYPGWMPVQRRLGMLAPGGGVDNTTRTVSTHTEPAAGPTCENTPVHANGCGSAAGAVASAGSDSSSPDATKGRGTSSLGIQAPAGTQTHNAGSASSCRPPSVQQGRKSSGRGGSSSGGASHASSPVPNTNTVAGGGTTPHAGGGGTASGGGQAQRPTGLPDPRRVMSRIKGASGIQDLSSLLRRHGPSLAGNTLLLAAALSRLARLATDPAAAAAAAAADKSNTGAAPNTAATVPQPPSSSSTLQQQGLQQEGEAGRQGQPQPNQPAGQGQQQSGSTEALAVLLGLMPAVGAAVPLMRVGELSSCAWALGRLRPLWGGGGGGRDSHPQQRQQQRQEQVGQEGRETEVSAVGAVADAIAARLAQDWTRNAGAAAAPTSAVATTPATATAPATAATTAAAAASSRQDGSQPQPLWQQAGTQDVANLAWGLARSGRGAAGNGSSGSSGSGAHEGAWQWLAGTACDVLWSGQAREVANLVWAFAVTGRPDPQVFGNLLKALLDRQRGPEVVRQLREEECTAVLWAVATAYGRLSYKATPPRGEDNNRERDSRDELSPPPPLPPSPTQPLGHVVGNGSGGGDGGSELSYEATGGDCTAIEEAASRLELARVMQRLGERAAELALHGKLTGRQTSSMLWSLAALQGATSVDLDPSWLQALARRAAQTARYMDGQALGNTAWALGALRFRHAGALDALCGAALTAIHQQQQRRRRGGSSSSSGSRRGDMVGDAAGVAAAAAAAGAAAAPPASRDLVQLLWACGRLRHVHQGFVSDAQAQLLPEVPRMDPWVIATLASSLASLGAHSAPFFTALCKRAQQLLPSHSPSSTPARDVTRTSSNRGQQQQAPLQPPQPQQQPEQPQRVQGAAGGRCLSGSQMAAVVTALGRVEHYDSGLIDEACERLCSRLHELQPWEVSGLVSALGRLEHPHAQLLAAVEGRVMYDIRPYKPSELATLLYGFASTDTRAESLFDRAAAVLHRRLGGLGAEELAQLAEAFAVAQSPDDELFEGIAAEALRRCQHFSWPQMERVALAFKSLGYEDSEDLIRAWREGGQG